MRDAAIDTSRSPARNATTRSRPSGAPLLDDMVGEGPLARGAPRRGGITSAAVAAQRLGGGRVAARGRKAPGRVARLCGRIPRVRPLKALTVGAFGVALVGIVANAMVFQRGHHPSPLFGLGRSLDGAPEAGEKAAAAPPAPAPPEKTGTIAPAVPTPAAAVPIPAPAAVVQPKPTPVRRAATKPHRDEVAKAKPPVGTPEAAASHPRPGRPTAKAEPRPEAKPDPVAKLLAGPARPAKPDGKGEPKGKSADASPAHQHHRVAAGEDAKPAAKTE